ncbi:hypothetical protein [Methanorbis rubei]|uniref:Uncharacterized protein n=1 Tax=Methanorbis rubei TaxID=3028300 RepID=A0AAE4SDZ9_9EURY|nr:hypothetical protein [Methanocorpusculaceae archaeon Cs1]
MPAFNTTLDVVLTGITTTIESLIQIWVIIIDMILSGPLLVWVGFGFLLAIAGWAFGVLGIGRKGRKGRR